MYVRRASLVLAVTLAALALAPAPAAAAQPAPAASSGPKQWALLLGVEDGPGDAGIQLRGDLEFPLRPLSPVVGFSIVGSLGFSRFTDGYTDWYTGESVDASLNLFKMYGSARFTFGHGAVRPYADAGLGLYYASWSWDYRDPFTGYGYGADDSDIGVGMRFAGGVTFQVSPGFALGAELGFNPYFGDAPDDTYTSLMASATFRM
jgi:opacity protein-like surface antigen